MECAWGPGCQRVSAWWVVNIGNHFCDEHAPAFAAEVRASMRRHGLADHEMDTSLHPIGTEPDDPPRVRVL